MNWLKNLTKNSGLRVQTLKTGQKLPGALLAIVLALDIYLVTVIFQGLSWTSAKIQTPVEQMSPLLLDLAKNPSQLWPKTIQLKSPDLSSRNWGLTSEQTPDVGAYISYNERNLEAGKIDVFTARHRYRLHEFSEGTEWVGLGTEKIAQEADEVLRADWQLNLNKWASQLKQLNAEISQKDQNIRGLVGNYDTMLRERSANLPQTQSLMQTSADKVRKNIEEERAQMEALILQRNNLISQYTPIQKIETWLTLNHQKIKDQNNTNNFWYSTFVTLAQTAFVLPIFILAIFWHRRNMKRTDAEVGTLVSSHLIYVSAIPIVSKIIQFLSQIIPFQLLYDLFKLLWNAGLQYLWSYLMVAVGIGIIFLLGRWILSHSKKTKAKFYIKCLEQGLCPKTGRKLPDDCSFSPYTGDAIKKVSLNGKESYRYAPFDSATGEPNPEWENLIK
jgi:stress response protein YsnF